MKILPLKKRYIIIGSILLFFIIILFAAPRKVNIDYFPLFKNEFVFKYISLDDTRFNIILRLAIGIDQLNASLDSLKKSRTGFITTYLSSERAISPERFRVVEDTPDSIITDIKYPVFRIYFPAGE